MNQDIKCLLLTFNQKPIAYHKAYTQITGKLTAGVMLSQLMYWYSAVGGREFYKTDEELREETGLSYRELRTAKKILTDKKLVSIKIKGVPAKTYYTINVEMLVSELTSLYKTDNLVCTNRTNLPVQIVPTITENTQKNTTERENTPPKNEKLYLNIIKTYNHIKGKEVLKSYNSWSNNVDYWLQTYTEEDIIKSIWHLLLTDVTWKPLENLTIFFRRKNKLGDVDNIGEMLIREVPHPDTLRGKSISSRKYSAILDYYEIIGR